MLRCRREAAEATETLDQPPFVDWHLPRAQLSAELRNGASGSLPGGSRNVRRSVPCSLRMCHL